MRITIFIISVLALFAFLPKNEAQQQSWNRFWVIRETEPQEKVQTYQQQTHKQFTTAQMPMANDNLSQGIPNPALYTLQKRPFSGTGETQFEYVLRN